MSQHDSTETCQSNELQLPSPEAIYCSYTIAPVGGCYTKILSKATSCMNFNRKLNIMLTSQDVFRVHENLRHFSRVSQVP